MVSYTQRRMRGGGTRPTSVALIQIVDATRIFPTAIFVVYSGAVTAASFAAANFNVLPTATAATAVLQITPTVLRINWAASIPGTGNLNYIGTVPGVLTPQTFAYHL